MSDRASKRDAAAVIVDDLPWDAPAGHLAYRRGGDGRIASMSFGCPCGCGAHYGARFYSTDQSSGWLITGAEDQPTVTPSLGCYPSGGRAAAVGADGYHWHGYLRAGVFEEC